MIASLFSTWYSRSKVKLIIQLFIINVYNPHCKRGSALLILSVNQQAFPAYVTQPQTDYHTCLSVVLRFLLYCWVCSCFLIHLYYLLTLAWLACGHIQSHSPGPDKTPFYWLLILPLSEKSFLHLDCVRGHDPCWPGLAQAPAAISWAAKYSLCLG